MIRVKTLLVVCGSVLLVSCGGGGEESQTPEAVAVAPLAECTYPDSPEREAPLWVCGTPVEGLPLSAVGSYQTDERWNQFPKTTGDGGGSC